MKFQLIVCKLGLPWAVKSFLSGPWWACMRSRPWNSTPQPQGHKGLHENTAKLKRNPTSGQFTSVQIQCPRSPLWPGRGRSALPTNGPHESQRHLPWLYSSRPGTPLAAWWAVCRARSHTNPMWWPGSTQAQWRSSSKVAQPCGPSGSGHSLMLWQDTT